MSGAAEDAPRRHHGEIADIYWVGDANAVPYDRRRELCEAAGLMQLDGGFLGGPRFLSFPLPSPSFSENVL